MGGGGVGGGWEWNCEGVWGVGRSCEGVWDGCEGVWDVGEEL